MTRWPFAFALAACYSADEPPPKPAPVVVDPYAAASANMVDTTIVARGVTDPGVIAAMRTVPRHELVLEADRARAYADTPLSIGHGQTISQPYIVAAMTEAAKLGRGSRVLEIGTGSGYQAAVLAALGADVYSIEIVEPLAKRTAATLARLGLGRIHLRIGDGSLGWPAAAPFDAIIATAAPTEIPPALVDQLRVGGRLVIPVGRDDQELRVITRGPDRATTEHLFAVRFVPMTYAR